MLRSRLADSADLPASFRNALGAALDRAVALAERVAGRGQDMLARQAATAAHNVTSAALLAGEWSRPGMDARRALLSRFVLVQRLSPADPLASEEAAWERPATDALLTGKSGVWRQS
jgi:acyl-CoA dehydrogenase